MNELPEETLEQINELSEMGNEFYSNEEYEKALEVWQKALTLIPHPQQFYIETVWFLSSIGDIFFIQKDFTKAHKCFDTARGNLSGDGYGNPFVMLRLGQCCLELGDEKNAIEYMLRAYILDGDEIFEEENPKYFEFLRTSVDLGENK